MDVGAARMSLDARPGLWLGGLPGRTEPAKGVLDQPMVRALVGRHGDEWLVLATLDLFGLDVLATGLLRHRIAEEIGCSADAVCIVCTHSHSAPASLKARGNMGRIDAEWLRQALETTIRCCCLAARRLRPCRASWGARRVFELVFDTDEDRPATSDLVLAVRFEASGGPVATLAWFSCKPNVLGPSNTMVSADYPGVAAREMDRWGGVGLFLPGAVADSEPKSNLIGGWDSGAVADVERLGCAIAEAAREAVSGGSEPTSDGVRCRGGALSVPVGRSPGYDELAEIEAHLREQWSERTSGDSATSWSDVYASLLEWVADARGADAGSWPDAVNAPLWRASFAGQDWIGLPFEVYRSTAERLKPAITISCANGYLGPLPPREALQKGGGGLELSYRWLHDMPGPLHHQAERLVRAAVLEL